MLSALLTASVSTVGDDAGAEFAAGYLWGVKAEDKRPYITSCFKTDHDLNNLLDQIMADYAKGDTKHGDAGWEKAKPKFEAAMAPCTDVTGEFEDLDKFAEDVMARPDAKKYIEGREKKYKAEINQLGGEMIARWQSGVYFDAGMYDGQIAQRIGLAPGPYTLEDDTRDPMAPAQMTAGWLFGISGQAEEMRDAIIACYKVNDSLTADYYDGMAAYQSGDSKTGDAKFNDAK